VRILSVAVNFLKPMLVQTCHVVNEPFFVASIPALPSGFTLLLNHTLNEYDMNKSILKSIGAVLAGLVFIGVTHSTIDAILESTGVLPKGHLNVGAGLILLVIAYRAVFSFAGCYLTAKLAPKDPMKHSLILGSIGTVLSAVGAVVTADMNIGPAWYAWGLAVSALPIAWLAGRTYVSKNQTTVV
jgi:hypothetical protein